MQQNKITILIDGDNISGKQIENVFNETSKYGQIISGYLYSDFEHLQENWKDIVNRYALTPRLHFNVASGKNASDIEMAVEAMKIMYAGNATTFFIVSNDADYTPLAKELKANDMTVYGIGNKHTPEALKNAYTKFISLEVLNEEEDDDATQVSEEDLAEIKATIRSLIIESEDKNRMPLSDLGTHLNNKMPAFDVRNYGVNNLSNLIRTLDDMDVQSFEKTPYAILDDVTPHKIEDVEKFIKNTLKENNGTFKLPKLHAKLKKKFTNFNYQDYGYTRFAPFIKSFKGIKTKDHDAILEQ